MGQRGGVGGGGQRVKRCSNLIQLCRQLQPCKAGEPSAPMGDIGKEGEGGGQGSKSGLASPTAQLLKAGEQSAPGGVGLGQE